MRVFRHGISRALPILVALLATTLGCGKTKLIPTSLEAGSAAPVSSGRSGTSSARAPGTGLLFVDADHRNLLPAARPGFSACSPDFGPGITIEQARTSLAEWRTRPREVRLHAHAVTVRRSMQTLSFASAAERGVLTIGDSLKSVHITRADIGAELRSANEWSPEYDDLLSGILPANALIVLALAERPSLDELAVRAYLVQESVEETSRALLASGAEAARALACSQEEGSFHRASYRVEDGHAGAARRIRLTASVFHGCTGGDAHADMRIIPDFAGGTLVLACLGMSDDEAPPCDALAASVRRKH